MNACVLQVMSFVSQLAQPMSKEEQDALRDILSTGGDILVQVCFKNTKSNDAVLAAPFNHEMLYTSEHQLIRFGAHSCLFLGCLW